MDEELNPHERHDNATILAHQHKILRKLEEVNVEFRQKLREVVKTSIAHQKGLQCLKTNTEKYVPMLDDIAKKMQRRRELYEKLIMTGSIIILTAAMGFIGLAIWNHFKHLSGL